MVVVVEETIELKRGRGRPEKDEPPTKISRADTRELLKNYDAAGMVKLLEQCYGSIEDYVRCFDHRLGARQQDILARTIYVLRRAGNETHLEQWNDLVESFHQSKVLLARAEALKLITNLKPPQRTGKNAGSAFDKTMAYAKFWLQQKPPKMVAQKAPELPTETDKEDDPPEEDFVGQIEQGIG